MNRRAFLVGVGAAALLPLLPVMPADEVIRSLEPSGLGRGEYGDYIRQSHRLPEAWLKDWLHEAAGQTARALGLVALPETRYAYNIECNGFDESGEPEHYFVSVWKFTA